MTAARRRDRGALAASSGHGRRRSTPWILAATFFLVLASQWLVTPVGEGLDVYGHLAYATFVEREGRWPTAAEKSVRADILRFREACLGPDYVCAGFYQRWRVESPAAQRHAVADAMRPEPLAPYVEPNYQAQHPPLYYLVLAPAVSVLRHAPLDRQVFWLGLVSIVLATCAIPFTYRALRATVPESAAVLGTLAMAWYPNLLPFLARMSNDTLAFAIAATLVAVVAHTSPTTRQMLLAGGLVGAGLWTKSYFVTLVPAILAWAATERGANGRWRIDWRSLAACAGALLVVAGPLLVHNVMSTGHLLPLVEARATATLPVSQKVGALLLVDPFWFLAGMARNFVWVGYWSFVSPAYTFYALVALAVMTLPLVARRRTATPATRLQAEAGLSSVPRRLSPTTVMALMVLVFLAGMWWHAALFRLNAIALGLERFSGNEGYYLNVLMPGLALMATTAAWRGAPARRGPVLGTLLGVMIASSLWARATMLVFWGGGAPIAGYERLLQWEQGLPALFDTATWSSAFSVPGVVSPALAGVALAAALSMTFLLARLTAREAGPETGGAVTGRGHAAGDAA